MDSSASSPCLHVVLAFNTSNQLAVRQAGSKLGLPFTGGDLAGAVARLEANFPNHTPPAEYFAAEKNGLTHRVYFSQVAGLPTDGEVVFQALETLERAPERLSPALAEVLQKLEPHLIDVPYLHLGENDFIFKFRPDKERNRKIYQIDDATQELYQSKLCSAIKALARTHERTASEPITLDFGVVQYLIPSHFGFCLGVKNAIERAYETLAENPRKRVFMLSELIHNPFVNEDLLRRGLRYLQSEKGRPYLTDGKPAKGEPGETTLWDTLTCEDIVIIPAFGATDEDKRRLVRKGVPVYQYDATCMLVEKVWKAARSLGREGYTVVIHGKHEHEETKATFSNARRHAPALIIRNLAEATVLGEIIRSEEAVARERFETEFAGKHTPGFDILRDLQRIAVVNQTTLLMNETLEIISYLRQVFAEKYGAVEGQDRVGGGGKRDTLCYATQVNQDALSRALAQPLDAAFVIGGKNSSNTIQLFRLCEQRLGANAFFIQSEDNIHPEGVDHFLYPAHGKHEFHADQHVIRPLEFRQSPARILLTGGASCPDGIIQQVIHRLNQRFPADRLRPIDEVLADLEQPQAQA